MHYCRHCYINIPLHRLSKSCICALLYHRLLAELKGRHQAWRRLFCCVRKRLGIYGTVLGAKAPNTAPCFVVALKPESPCAVGISGRSDLSRQPFLAPTLSPAFFCVVPRRLFFCILCLYYTAIISKTGTTNHQN